MENTQDLDLSEPSPVKKGFISEFTKAAASSVAAVIAGNAAIVAYFKVFPENLLYPQGVPLDQVQGEDILLLGGLIAVAALTIMLTYRGMQKLFGFDKNSFGAKTGVPLGAIAGTAASIYGLSQIIPA